MATFSDFNIEIPLGATGNIKTLCPSCSPNRKKLKEKCLSVNVEEGIWNCHHCGHHGGLKEKNEGYQKPKSYSRPVFTKQPLSVPVVGYFQKRGIPQTVLDEESISFGTKGGKNWIQFPYFKGGQVVNIKHRSNGKDFYQETNAEKCLYRFDAVLNGTGNRLIITEGEIDTLSFLAVGEKVVSSIPDGAPSSASSNYTSKFNFLDSAEEIFKRYNIIILAMDNDEPGKIAERELARRIGVEKCWRVEYPEGCKDANDVLVKFGPERLLQVADEAKPFPIEGLLTTSDLKQDVMTLYDMGSKRGCSTGWYHMDQHYTVKPGELTIVTGIPQHGKSNFIDALSINLARNLGWSFAVFSPENWPPERHLQTLIEKYTLKPFDKDGHFVERMSKDEASQAVDKLKHHYFFIVPKEEVMNIDTILDKAKIAVFRYGIDGIIIDPWNEVEHNYGDLTEVQYISRELTKLRRFARFNGVHIWVIAHPKNLVKNGLGKYDPPTMYEISGGAHWRNKADNGLCVHRPDFAEDITEVHVQKIRFKETGRTGIVKFKYSRDTGIYLSESNEN